MATTQIPAQLHISPSPSSSTNYSSKSRAHKPKQHIPFQTLELTNKHFPILILVNNKKPLNSTSYASIIDSCKCPSLGTQIHGHLFKTGFCSDHFVETKLLQMYARCGLFQDANSLFDKMPTRNVYSWAAILSLYNDLGRFKEAFRLFLELQLEDVVLEFFLFPVLFKICSGIGELGLARQVHGIAVKSKVVENIYVGNALIDVYGKCGSLDFAKRVLAMMPVKDLVSWNSIVTACTANGMVYEALEFLDKMTLDESSTPNLVSWSAVLGGFSQNGHDEEAIDLLFRMRETGFEPNARTLASVLPSCARLQRLNLGKEIHGYITRHGFTSNLFLVNGLVDVYRRCGDMRNASAMFSNFSLKNAVSCNTMIVGYSENGDISKAKELFDRMESMGVQKDVISWNSIISGHVDNCLFDEAFRLFQELLEEGIEPDSFTLGSVLTACADTSSQRRGKVIHGHAIKRGLQSNPFVGGAVVEMYCRCQDLLAARKAFNEATERDIATWNTLITGYTRLNQIQEIPKFLQMMRADGFEPNVYTWNGIITGHVENNHLDSAMELFSQMQISNLKPDIYAVGIILQACSRSATVERGKQVHAYSLRHWYDSDVHIGAALVDMYSKCGSLRHGLLAYDRISNPDLVSHNALLTAYATHGRGEEGIAFFRSMLENGFRPDHVTFLSVLSSCIHVGSVETGYEFFNLMRYYDVRPTLKHYTCIVDLLSRASRLDEAYKFIKSLPVEPDSVLWGALLGGCVIHRNVKLGEIAAERLIELEPNNTGNYVLLANLYAYSGKWNDLARMRRLMKDQDMHKSPGCSWIEDRDEIHIFLASDKSHKRSKEIYGTLDNLVMHMKTGLVSTL